MTFEQWKQIEGKMQTVWSPVVKLMIDGYNVSLALRQISQFQNAILVYVNGELNLKWLTEDCEERKRFFPCKKRCLTNANELKKLGIKRKNEIQKYKQMGMYEVYLPYWTSFKAMKKHLQKHNKNIQLVEVHDEKENM